MADGPAYGLWELISSDLRISTNIVQSGEQKYWLHVAGKLLVNPRVRAAIWYRIAHHLATHRMLTLALLIRGRVLRISGAEIHPLAQIGPSLVIVHSSGVVIGGGVVIGQRCMIHQGVTLGEPGRGRAGEWGEPVLGDDVTLGAHAVILGPRRIGDRAVVAANAVVTQDVPADTVVGGVPAKVLRVNAEASA